MTVTCVCCGATSDLRGVNLKQGSFTLCRFCRDEWEFETTRGFRWALKQAEGELADARRTIRAALDPGIQREWQAAAGTNDDKENV